MKATLFALTALGAIAAASPAAAQSYGYGGNGYYGQNGYYSSTNQDRYYDRSYQTGYGWEGQLNSRAAIDARINRLDARLNAGIRAGTIDRYEADRLRAEINDLRYLSRSYAYGGISGQERAEIAQRMRRVREDIRMADNGSWDRYDNSYWGGGSTGYGYNNGYGTSGTYGNGYSGYGTYGNGYGTYGNGYGSYNNGYSGTYNNGYGSTYGNGSSYNNGYYGQGGPYEEVDNACQSRGGIGGVIDDVLGRDNCSTTLRVGQRVSGGLYAVPYELQSRYRDGYGYYYRSDGRSIYQIDARTNTVLRVYSMDR